MKRVICLTIAVIFLVISITACTQKQISNDSNSIEKESLDNSSSHSQDGISDNSYSNMFRSFSYESVEELYIGLRDFDSDDLNNISFIENEYMEDTRNKTFVSKDEEKNGIFGDMRNKLLTERTLMMPYYKGEKIPFRNKEGSSNIKLYAADYARKPIINFSNEIDGVYFIFHTTYFDDALITDANEKGASWLISQINPEGVNVDTYKKINLEFGINISVYEKEFRLGDRYVLATIIDETPNGVNSIGLYFVYDDILVFVRNTLEVLETILPNITFREVDFPTNTPLRETPGREGTIFSTRTTEYTVITDHSDTIKTGSATDLSAVESDKRGNLP